MHACGRQESHSLVEHAHAHVHIHVLHMHMRYIRCRRREGEGGAVGPCARADSRVALQRPHTPRGGHFVS